MLYILCSHDFIAEKDDIYLQWHQYFSSLEASELVGYKAFCHAMIEFLVIFVAVCSWQQFAH